MGNDKAEKLQLTVPAGGSLGGSLFEQMTAGQQVDGYTPNGLAEIDMSLFPDEVIATLQKRALQLE